MLNLNTGVHLHKEVAIAINNALKSRHRIQTHSLTEPLRFRLHRVKRYQILSQHFGLFAAPFPRCHCLGGNKRLPSNRHFQQLLFMHLQGTVAPAKGYRPLSVTHNLNFLMASRFNVELNQYVLVVTDASCLHFIENFTDHFRCFIGFIKPQNPLTFTTAAANCLESHPVFGVFSIDSLDCLNDGF